MKQFASRAIREILFGTIFGAIAALLFQILNTLLPQAFRSAAKGVPASFVTAAKNAPDLRPLLILLLVISIFLLTPPLKTLGSKLYRSWSVGLITGILPVWFVLVFLFFVPQGRFGWNRILAFTVIGALFVMVSWLNLLERSKFRTDFSIVTPEPASALDDTGPDRAVTFDLPIQVWAQDKLRRGQFVSSIAKLILQDEAPVIGIVGPFGEGKTSTLNLLGESLRPRSDLIVVRFSSWLPGDEQALAISLFATIDAEIKKRFLVFGLSSELKRFAKLLVGAVPKVGGSLIQFFDSSSQVEQLRGMKRLLGRLPVRVVVLVDELDRMDRSELLILLKAIRGVVDLPNLTYVCGFDTRAVERLISPEDRDYGTFYLEKFFPMKVALPRIDLELLGGFFDRQMESICKTFGLLQDETEKKRFAEAIKPVWLKSVRRVLTNFRTMSLFFNSFRMALEPVYDEVNLFDMLVLHLVKSISEETYEFIYDNGPVFYDAGLGPKYWEERLSVDDRREAELRKKLISEHFESLTPSVRPQVIELLSTIFPIVRLSVERATFSRKTGSSEEAEAQKRIYHPDYFPRYFIHQVPAGLFGQKELSSFITQLNGAKSITDSVSIFRRTFSELEANPWKRWDFLRNLVNACGRLGDAQCRALVEGVAAISDSMEADFLGLGEWGRARAIVFVAANRFSGTPALQQLICNVIKGASSDGFAADIMRFSTGMRDQNKIITDWTNVDQGVLRMPWARKLTSPMTGTKTRDRFSPGQG
jgi:hypothetical protein